MSFVTETTVSRGQTTLRTRAALVDAAISLFVAHGFEAVSLRDVASAAGVSHTALNRHFPTKALLFEACVAELEKLALQQLSPLDGSVADVVAVARANAAVPGYVALTSGLLGAAIAHDHPAYDRYRRRYEELHPRVSQLIRASDGVATAASGSAADDESATDHDAHATRLIAAWDGLQVLSLYLPDAVDVGDVLARRLTPGTVGQVGAVASSHRGDNPDAREFSRSPLLGDTTTNTPAADGDGPAVGYSSGRVRRENLVDGAINVFARSGFHGSSLRDTAQLIGVSKSTMLHHFPTKAALLAAVLAERDRRVQLIDDPTHPPMDRLRMTAQGSREHQSSEPGLIRLYAILSTEATAASHPAHEYFAERYRAVLGTITDLMRGIIGDGRDPAFEALWYVALWDGLQFQWLLDPAVDVAGHLDAHITELGRAASTESADNSPGVPG
jgi:AcrR family transcriptional regulator